MDAKGKRFLVLFLVLGLGVLALSACQMVTGEEVTDDGDTAMEDDDLSAEE